MPVVRAVLALVVPTMAAMAVDVPVAPWAHALPASVLATTMDVSAPAAAPVASAGRATPSSAVVPMAAAAFAVAVAPTVPVQHAPAPATPVDLPVALAAPAAPSVPAVGPSLSNAMVRDEKRVFYLLFTCWLVSLT